MPGPANSCPGRGNEVKANGQTKPLAPAPSGPTLGVVAISHNEERDLVGFLENLLPWVDEIVIIDDGSTDRTVELARAAGSKVRLMIAPRQAGEYYSHQRNKGIAAAQSDWLLHMDVDERVTPALAAEIREAIQDPAKDGYRFRRLNFFLHRPMRGGGWQNWNLVHLARRDKFRFGGKMHESCHLDASADRVGQLRGLMWHLNDDGYLERLRKSYGYCQVEAENILERGQRVCWHHLLWPPLRLFLKRYLFQWGFRDGLPGLIAALSAAGATLRSYALVWDAQNQLSRQELEREVRRQWPAGAKPAAGLPAEPAPAQSAPGPELLIRPTSL